VIDDPGALEALVGDLPPALHDAGVVDEDGERLVSGANL
jgi:hypothetical protein